MIRLWRIGQLLAAMIVVIAASLAPSAAQAHAGHAHSPAAAVVVAPAQVAEPAVDAAFIVSTIAPTRVVATASNAPETPLPCNGPCCSGAFCCVPALLPEPVEAASHRLGSSACWGRDPPVSAGIDPEALPKPPRSFV